MGLSNIYIWLKYVKNTYVHTFVLITCSFVFKNSNRQKYVLFCNDLFKYIYIYVRR